MLHTTRTSIIWGTGLVVLVTAVIQYFKWLPMPSYSFIVDGVTSTNGVGCLMSGCLTWCLLLVFAPPLHIWETWFLDKACICQHDEGLKQQGIQELGSFLDCSEQMVLLLSPRYFERGWCTFEVATFLAQKGVDAVTLVPLLRAKLVVSIFGVSVFGIAVFHASSALGLSNAVAFVQPQPMIHGVPVFVLLLWQLPTGLVLALVALLMQSYMKEQKQILRQVAGFRFSRAKFAEEADRAFVFHSIERLFGSLEDFEAEVQSKVLRKVTQELGDDQVPLRFEAIVTGTVPWLWWAADMVCTDQPEYQLLDVDFGVLMALALLPVWFVLLVVLERQKLHLLRQKPEWCQAMGSVGLFLFAALSSTVFCAATSQALYYEALPISISFTAFWTVLAIACFSPQCCSSNSATSRMTEELIPLQASI